MVAGDGGHDAGGMNDGKAAATTGAGRGVLIAVRFARADMSTNAHTTNRHTALPGESDRKIYDR